MITFETISKLELATLKEGDLVQVLGEFSEGDVALMTGKVYPALHDSSNRLVTIANGLKVEVFPTPLGDKDVTKKYVNQQDDKIKEQVNNLHTKREAIEWRSGLHVTDELQLYVKDGVEYLPDSGAVPFTTGNSFDAGQWVLSKLMTQMEHWRDAGDVRGWGVKGDLNLIKVDPLAAAINPHLIPVIDYDNATDDTAALAACTSDRRGKAVIFEPNKAYLVNSDASDNICVRFYSGMIVHGNFATIAMKPTGKTHYDIVANFNENAIIYNNLSVIGDVLKHTGTTGEWGYGFTTYTSSNITYNNCEASLCWGDGFITISDATKTNYNINYNECVSDANRRQGASLAGGLGINYNKCIFKNTGIHKATAPAAGLDIEPDDNKICDIDAKVIGCMFSNNAGGAMHCIIQPALSGVTLKPGECIMSILVNNCSSDSDSSIGAMGRAPLRIGGSKGTYTGNVKNKIRGCVTISDFEILNAAKEPIMLTNYSKLYPPLILNNIPITDAYSGVALGDDLGVSCLITLNIFAEYLNDPDFDIGSIDCNNITYTDTRGDIFSQTATETNQRIKRVVWGDNINDEWDMSKFRFRHFKTNIVPPTFNFMFNTDKGNSWDIGKDALTKYAQSSILTSDTGAYWGLGVTPLITPSSIVDFTIDMPTTDKRAGTYQYIHSSKTSGRIIFRACQDASLIQDSVQFLDGDEINARSENKILTAKLANLFTFYCPTEGVWVQQ